MSYIHLFLDKSLGKKNTYASMSYIQLFLD